jgi:hypothetical protein
MNFKQGSNVFKTLIIGAGPAGTGPLVNAQQRGILSQTLDEGVAIVDRTAVMGGGNIGQYIINSDTMGNTFLECLINQETGPFQHVFNTEAKRSLDQYRQSAAPLRLVGEFMGEIGKALQQVIDQHPISQFFPGTEAHEIHRDADGLFHTTLIGADGKTFEIVSQYVVTALGARQHLDRTLNAEIVPGLNLADNYAPKTLLTNHVLTDAGPVEIEKRLKESSNRKVVIIGASHSTFSSGWVLLNKTGLTFDEGDITILHRQKLKIFYPTVEAAHAEGYFDFDENDLCPLTKRVYRLGGLRWDSRDLLKRIWGVGGAPLEKRVRLVELDPTNQHNAVDIQALLDDAVLIIPAFGYRPITVPLFDASGEPIDLLGNGEGAPPLVDDGCRVLDAQGIPIPNYYGIGLASGFMLSGALGGEPSFKGQTNGLWLYQNGVGEIILNQMIAPVTA